MTAEQHLRLGEKEESYVLAYMKNPTQSGRDYIVSMCDRFLKFVYKKYLLKIVPWEEFYQDGVVRVLTLLDSFDPAKGTFVGWVLVGLDGLARATRHKSIRYNTDFRLSGLIPKDALQTQVFSPQDTSCSLPERLIPKLKEVEVRFTASWHREVFKSILCFLLRYNRFPTFQEVWATWSQSSYSEDDVYQLWEHLIIRVRLHFMREEERGR